MTEKTTLQELEYFIENQEYNFLNKELLDFANKLKEKIKILQTKEENTNVEKSTQVGNDAKLFVSRNAVEPLIETLFLIVTAPYPTNDFEFNSFVETAKMISQKALDDFNKHFC